VFDNFFESSRSSQAGMIKVAEVDSDTGVDGDLRLEDKRRKSG
jgi:hypothetical protein